MPSIGKPLPHDSAVGHVTGKAPYIDDLPPRIDELYVGFVGSPVAAGRIESIDLDAARALPGVVALYTADDLPGKNIFGAIICDEPVLAKGKSALRGAAGGGCRGRVSRRSGEGAAAGENQSGGQRADFVDRAVPWN